MQLGNARPGAIMNGMLPEAHYDLPPEKYPIRIEALHWITKAVVWSKTVELPNPGAKVRTEIPPLRKMFGHPVAMRMTFGDGEVRESPPVLAN